MKVRRRWRSPNLRSCQASSVYNKRVRTTWGRPIVGGEAQKFGYRNKVLISPKRGLRSSDSFFVSSPTKDSQECPHTLIPEGVERERKDKLRSRDGLSREFRVGRLSRVEQSASFDHLRYARTGPRPRDAKRKTFKTLPTMANVLTQLPQFGFNSSRSPNHPPLPVAPTPAIMAGWGHTIHQPPVTHQLPATRVQKRRLEQEDEDGEARPDIVMERTPTPERPKRAPPKRARRADPSNSDGSSNNQDSKDGGPSENEVDIGMLLGISISSSFSRPSLIKVYA